MITFDSAQIFTSLAIAKAQMSQEVKDRTGDKDLQIDIIYYGFSGDGQFTLKISGKYGSEKAEVKGKHLEQLMTEALRRLGFNEAQENLQLTHQTEIEAEVVESEAEASESGFDVNPQSEAEADNPPY